MIPDINKIRRQARFNMALARVPEAHNSLPPEERIQAVNDLAAAITNEEVDKHINAMHNTELIELIHETHEYGDMH